MGCRFGLDLADTSWHRSQTWTACMGRKSYRNLDSQARPCQAGCTSAAAHGRTRAMRVETVCGEWLPVRPEPKVRADERGRKMVAAVVRRRRARPHTPSWAVRRAMTSLRSSVRKDAQRVRFRVCLGTSDEVQATVSSNRIHPWTKLPGSRALALTAKGLLCFVDGKMYSKCSGRAALSPCRIVDPSGTC